MIKLDNNLCVQLDFGSQHHKHALKLIMKTANDAKIETSVREI